MALDWILQGRYLTGLQISLGKNTGTRVSYGDPAYISQLPVVFQRWDQTIESAPSISGIEVEVDASRNMLYFDTEDSRIYMGGEGNGITVAGETAIGNDNKLAVNRLVNFMNNVYFLVSNKVFIFNESTKVWSESFSLTGKDSTRSNSIGLYPVVIGSTPYLYTAWNTTTSTWQAARLNGLTNTWELMGTAASILNPSDANGGILNEIRHKSRIYFIDSTTVNVAFYDFATDTFGLIPWPDSVMHPMDFCAYNGELYCLNKSGDGVAQYETIILLYKINNESISLVDNFFGSHRAITNTNDFEGRNMLFVDNIYDSNNPVLYAYSIEYGDIRKPITTGPPPPAPGGKVVSGLGGELQHGLGGIAIRIDGSGTVSQLWSTNVSNGPTVSGNLNNLPGEFPASPFYLNPNSQGTWQTLVSKTEGTQARCIVNQKNREDDRSEVTCFVRYLTSIQDSTIPLPFDVGNIGPHEDDSWGGGGKYAFMPTFKWQGSGNIPFPQDNGFNHNDSWSSIGWSAKEQYNRTLPHEKVGGGARQSTILPGGYKAPDIVFRGSHSTGSNGEIRVNYNVITTSGVPDGSTVHVKWYFDDKLHAPETPCSIIDVSHGSLSGNTIILEASGNVDYWAEWDSLSDGVARFSPFNINASLINFASGTGPISSPEDLTGLVFWLEADDKATITSGVLGDISAWTHKGSSTGLTGITQPTSGNQPLYVDSANNGLGGVRFTSGNQEYMFASGSPIDNSPMTMFIVYETKSIGADQTMFSLANDTTPSGNYHNVSTASLGSSLIFESQDLSVAGASGSLPASGIPSPTGLLPGRTLTLGSGAIINRTVLGIWKEQSFVSEGQTVLSGVWNNEASSAIIPSGLSNTTVGRFTGAKESGVYGLTGEYFNGLVYEVAMYNRVLDVSEIDKFKVYISNKYTLT